MAAHTVEGGTLYFEVRDGLAFRYGPITETSQAEVYVGFGNGLVDAVKRGRTTTSQQDGFMRLALATYRAGVIKFNAVKPAADEMVDALRAMYVRLVCGDCVLWGQRDKPRKLGPVYDAMGRQSMKLGILRRAAGEAAATPGHEAVRLADGKVITDLHVAEVSVLRDYKGALPISCELLGQHVQLRDLQSSPQLNLQFGLARSFDAERERYDVVLDGSGQTVCVRERNLRPASRKSQLPMHVVAAMQGDKQQAVLGWLAEGGDVDARATNPADRRGVTMLMLACTKGYERVVETLIEHNASLDLQEDPPGGALVRALNAARSATMQGVARAPHLANVRRLLRAGAAVDVQDGGGVTPLMLAAQLADEGLVDALLERGADPNLSDLEGVTALFDAVGCNSSGIVAKLLTAGARTDITDCDGKTPLMIAQRDGLPLVVRAFHQHAAANTRPTGGHQQQSRALDSAAARADAAMAELLAAEGSQQPAASMSKKARKRRAKKAAQEAAARESNTTATTAELSAAIETLAVADVTAAGTAAEVVQVSDDPPDEFVCPISQEVMQDPVFATDGHTYERQCIEQWLATKRTSPKTGEGLQTADVFPNHIMRRQIIEWRERQA